MHGSFKVLVFPEYCDPPVGLYWPITITYESFCASLKSQFFTAFHRLLTTHDQVLRTWFQSVGNHTKTMVVQPTIDARPLWAGLTAPAMSGNEVFPAKIRLRGSHVVGSSGVMTGPEISGGDVATQTIVPAVADN